MSRPFRTEAHFSNYRRTEVPEAMLRSKIQRKTIETVVALIVFSIVVGLFLYLLLMMPMGPL